MTKEKIQNSYFKKERTTFGKMCKYLWIGFNILFLLWVIFIVLMVLYGFVNGSYISDGEVDPTLGIGLIISVLFFVFIFVVGNVILGLMTLFTKPKKS
ncbi:hypothetical protein [Flavobacterium sp. K5-23]|uniref:hypothetical protein n=1 Tax=Flavobacterium sp. K5-23 TaxID=2746225 RepID=UPI002010A6E7|nr:hypothetical protein [Flavobacterium sp. K5-23]UQD57235.1 hypothetical protein FLAK523_12860 [Flavobacterium sp. K5-23]